jgi:hypothetical protein
MRDAREILLPASHVLVSANKGKLEEKEKSVENKEKKRERVNACKKKE